MEEEKQRTPSETLRQWMYYFIIGIISFVALVFLPMIGSSVGLGWNVPNTVVGWIVWVAIKIIVAVINVLIFYSFMQQAKLNIKDNPKYKEAQEILCRVKIKNYIPRSPDKWNAEQYAKKGTTIFITSALTTVALTQAILAFDWVAMLTYLFTIIMGLIFGVLQMKSAEEYWTEEFWKYAMMVKEQNEKAEAEAKEAMDLAKKERAEQANDSMGTDSRADILEPSNSNSDISNTSKPVVLDSSNSDNSILDRTIYPSDAVTDRPSLAAKAASLQNKKENKGEKA